jgi:hypothetical protein
MADRKRRLLMTNDEVQFVEPLLEKYRVNKEIVKAYNDALEAAANTVASAQIADFPSPGDAITFLCSIIRELRKEFP